MDQASGTSQQSLAPPTSAGSSSPPRRASFGTFHSCASHETTELRRHLRSSSFSSFHAETRVLYKGRPCVLRFSDGVVSFTPDRPHRSSAPQTVLSIRVADIINIETLNESVARRQLRRLEQRGLRDREGHPQSNGNHSSSSIRGEHSEGNNNSTSSGGSSTRQMSRATSITSNSGKEVYLMHVLRRVSGLAKGSIQTIQFCATESLPLRHPSTNWEVEEVLSQILARIYALGPKHIIVFVSEKSGKGNGLKIFEHYIQPVLHFSRHTFEYIVTSRAHQCEDFVADLRNPLDSQYVVAVAGGDGMIHEAVNGLHRRKLALLHMMRSKSVPSGCDLNPEEVIELLFSHGWYHLLPPIATIATGSACGLAKSLNVLSPDSSALALVHLSTCNMDLLHLRFTQNADMIAGHSQLLTKRKRSDIERQFDQYRSRYGQELVTRQDSASEREPSHASAETGSPAGSPFLTDGSGVFENAVAHYLGAPTLTSRVAFMSMSFGVVNAVDHGSEHLRWMGNARFTVYGGYVFLKGLRTYRAVIRYLPWVNASGIKLEKLNQGDRMPERTELPFCTMRDQCPHCRQYQPAVDFSTGQTLEGCATLRDASCPLGNDFPPSLADYTDEQLLNMQNPTWTSSEEEGQSGEQWTTLSGEFFSIMVCGLRDAAQDMVMAPAAHLSDGAVDLVFIKKDEKSSGGGRMEFFHFVTGLEHGTHVNRDSMCYVKARAVEVKVDDGISMADGEMMPLSSVRISKIRNAVQFVRTE